MLSYRVCFELYALVVYSIGLDEIVVCGMNALSCVVLYWYCCLFTLLIGVNCIVLCGVAPDWILLCDIVMYWVVLQGIALCCIVSCLIMSFWIGMCC